MANLLAMGVKLCKEMHSKRVSLFLIPRFEFDSQNYTFMLMERNVRTYGVIRIPVVVYERCQVSVSSNSTYIYFPCSMQYAECHPESKTEDSVH